MASLPPIFRRYPIASSCGALWLLLLAALFVRSGTLDDAKVALGEKETEGNRIEKNVQNGVGMDKQLEALSAGLSKLEARLINAGDVGPNKQYFYDLEATSGVKISALRSSGAAKSKVAGSAYRAIGYEVMVEGRFAQVTAFLQALEAGVHHCRLVNFNVQRTGQESTGGKGGNVVLNLNLELLASS